MESENLNRTLLMRNSSVASPQENEHTTTNPHSHYAFYILFYVGIVLFFMAAIAVWTRTYLDICRKPKSKVSKPRHDASSEDSDASGETWVDPEEAVAVRSDSRTTTNAQLNTSECVTEEEEGSQESFQTSNVDEPIPGTSATAYHTLQHQQHQLEQPVACSSTSATVTANKTKKCLKFSINDEIVEDFA